MHSVQCCKVALDVDARTMTFVMLHARLELIGMELCAEREDQCCYTVKEAQLDEDGNNVTTVMNYTSIKALIAYQYSVLRSYENIYSIGYGTVTGDYVGLFRPNGGMERSQATNGLWVEMTIHVDESYGGTGQKMVHFDFPEEIEILLSPFTSQTVSPSRAPSTFSPYPLPSPTPNPSPTPGPEPSPSPSPSPGGYESRFECPYPSMTPSPSPSPATSWSMCSPLATALDEHHYSVKQKENVSDWSLFEPKYRSWYADCVETFRIQKARHKYADSLQIDKDGYLLPRLLFDYFSGGMPVISYCLNKMEIEESNSDQKFPRGVQMSGVWSERVGNVTRQAMVRDGRQIGNGYIVDRTGNLVTPLAAAVDADLRLQVGTTFSQPIAESASDSPDDVFFTLVPAQQVVWLAAHSLLGSLVGCLFVATCPLSIVIIG